MESIVLHLKLLRGIRGTLSAYVVWGHVKMAQISLVYGTYLNLDKEMITRAPIIDNMSHLKLN